jgi:hypothetical protein
MIYLQEEEEGDQWGSNNKRMIYPIMIVWFRNG